MPFNWFVARHEKDTDERYFAAVQQGKVWVIGCIGLIGAIACVILALAIINKVQPDSQPTEDQQVTKEL